MKHIRELYNRSAQCAFLNKESEFVEALEDHHSDDEAPEDHCRDEEALSGYSRPDTAISRS